MQKLELGSTFYLNAGAAEKNAESKNPETFEQNIKEHFLCLILSVFNIFLLLCLYATFCTHVISTYTLVFYSFLQLSAIYNLHQYDDIPLMITERTKATIFFSRDFISLFLGVMKKNTYILHNLFSRRGRPLRKGGCCSNTSSEERMKGILLKGLYSLYLLGAH